MQSLHSLLIDLHVRNWNRVVPAKYRFVREEGDHMVFLHPTKGFRFISKKRLAV